MVVGNLYLAPQRVRPDWAVEQKLRVCFAVEAQGLGQLHFTSFCLQVIIHLQAEPKLSGYVQFMLELEGDTC